MNAAHEKAPSGQAGGGWQISHSPTPTRKQGRAFRQLPPYGNQARQRLHSSQSGHTPAFSTLFVHVGHAAWDWRDDPRAFVLSPNFQDVEACDWSVCQLATPPILIIDRGAGDEHLERVALACLRDGAQKVIVLQPGHASVLLKAQGGAAWR